MLLYVENGAEGSPVSWILYSPVIRKCRGRRVIPTRLMFRLHVSDAALFPQIASHHHARNKALLSRLPLCSFQPTASPVASGVSRHPSPWCSHPMQSHPTTRDRIHQTVGKSVTTPRCHDRYIFRRGVFAGLDQTAFMTPFLLFHHVSSPSSSTTSSPTVHRCAGRSSGQLRRMELSNRIYIFISSPCL